MRDMMSPPPQQPADSAKKKTESKAKKKKISEVRRTYAARNLTAEYPCTRLGIQPVHLPLVRLALIREFLGSRTILPLISCMALLKRVCHRLALSSRARTQRKIVLILSVDLALALQK